MGGLFLWMTLVPLSILIVFQIALAAGAPMGHMAWGGQHEGRLPGLLRAASAVTVVFLLMGVAAAVRVGGLALDLVPLTVARAFLWALTAVMGFSILGNAATSSAAERAFGVPISIVPFIGLLGLLLWP